MRRILMTALASAAVAAASPAFAGTSLTLIESSDPCTLAYTGAVACQGYYGGNLDNTTVADQQSALNQLLTSPTVGTAVGGTAPTIDWNALKAAGSVYDATALGTGATANNLYFGTTLYGYVILGAHFGNNSDTSNPPPNVSAFWLFDFGTDGADHITFTPNSSGFSNAVLYTPRPAVPEPATWAMMLLGFGGIGMAMRRNRSRRSGTALMQIA
jgi:hypothetical protein